MHTNVTHKRKPGKSVSYAAFREVTHADGKVEIMKGGAQGIEAHVVEREAP